MAVTSTEFLSAVKRQVTVPASQIRFSNSDILAIADEEIMRLIMPMMLSLRQEFLVVQENVAIVGGQAAYKIPYRAVGRTLREIKITDTSSQFIYPIPYVVPEDTQYFNWNPTTPGDISGYTVRGDNIVFFPTPPQNTNLVAMFFYEMSPSKLIETDEAGVVSSIDLNTGIVTLEQAISGFSTGQEMDFVDGKSGNSILAFDKANTNVSGVNISFATSDFPQAPNNLKVGDYICLAQETPVLPLPNETSMVLVQATVVKMLEAQGDFEGMQVAERKLQQNIEAAEKLLTPRVEANVPTVVNQNGLLRKNMWGSWYYRGQL